VNRLFLAAAGVLLIAVAPLPADEPKTPAQRQIALLKLFADEFVTLTPGKGKFPAKFRMGSDEPMPRRTRSQPTKSRSWPRPPSPSTR
jgi:hypothetical protein